MVAAQGPSLVWRLVAEMLGCVTPGTTPPHTSLGLRGSEACVCACGEGKVSCVGWLDGLLLTWLGNSQELRYRAAGHLAITEGTTISTASRSLCRRADMVWWFGFSVASDHPGGPCVHGGDYRGPGLLLGSAGP